MFQSEAHGCPDCGKRYSTSSNLARHRQTHRSLGDKKARRCPHCDKVYVSMPAFSMHVRTHNQGCKCPYCGKCFSRPWLLQGHIRTHTGTSPVSSVRGTREKNFVNSLRRMHLTVRNLYLNGKWTNSVPTAIRKPFSISAVLYDIKFNPCISID